jgi:1-acyl-sn-glycerol-3-phosphate acyltransferase
MPLRFLCKKQCYFLPEDGTMLTLSYRSLRRFLRVFPFCPKPKGIGHENIPQGEPVILVYNHIIRRTEPMWLGVGAPAGLHIRFLADTRIADPRYLSILKRDLRNALFSQRLQERAKRHRWSQKGLEKIVNFLSWYVIAQTNRLDVIPANLEIPSTKEEQSLKFNTNKKALRRCKECLENNIPIAIAPSGGKTHESFENPMFSTTIPMLASQFYKEEKVVKIVPSIVKENPVIGQKTYWHYVADRFLPYRMIRQLMAFLRIKNYSRSRLTVEFLPPLTFEKIHPTKDEKIDFVKKLLQVIFDNLKN